MIASVNPDLPITALCIVADKTKCPPNYIPVVKCYDSSAEPDLWRDGLFGRSVNRYICFTKEFPIADTFNVIEDIKLLNEGTISGFLPIDKCQDCTEKSFQRKSMCVKISPRHFTQTAVSDIIILKSTKRSPPGYSFIGEVNGHTICVKFSPIPQTAHANTSPYGVSSSSSRNTPPIPPRPPSLVLNNKNGYGPNPNFHGDENGFVVVGYETPGNQQHQQYGGGGNGNNNHDHSLRSPTGGHQYNPLSGVPFEINPVYSALRHNNNEDEDFDFLLSRNSMSVNETLNKCQYDFKLEKTCVSTP